MSASATPLDPDESAGLVPGHIATREQLDEWEAENILAGRRWAARAAKRREILDDAFLRELHRRMFERTWKWAGSYRASEENIGIAPERVAEEVRKLLEDTKARLAGKVAPTDEIAARFHHRLVSIHPFPNGNGRHARLLTDLLLAANGAEPFTWGRGDLEHAGEARERYLAALRAADARDFAPLLAFVRSGA
ncbi:MAG: mobile mystery protein B [Burkholderiales bacterium]